MEKYPIGEFSSESLIQGKQRVTQTHTDNTFGFYYMYKSGAFTLQQPPSFLLASGQFVGSLISIFWMTEKLRAWGLDSSWVRHQLIQSSAHMQLCDFYVMHNSNTITSFKVITLMSRTGEEADTGTINVFSLFLDPAHNAFVIAS